MHSAASSHLPWLRDIQLGVHVAGSSQSCFLIRCWHTWLGARVAALMRISVYLRKCVNLLRRVLPTQWVRYSIDVLKYMYWYILSVFCFAMRSEADVLRSWLLVSRLPCAHKTECIDVAVVRPSTAIWAQKRMH